LFISKKTIRKDARKRLDMSEEGDTFWVSLAERIFGLALLVIGAIMIYFTATSSNVLGGFTVFFGSISAVLVIVGIVLLLVKPPE
jgi:hypothetical protein